MSFEQLESSINVRKLHSGHCFLYDLGKGKEEFRVLSCIWDERHTTTTLTCIGQNDLDKIFSRVTVFVFHKDVALDVVGKWSTNIRAVHTELDGSLREVMEGTN